MAHKTIVNGTVYEVNGGKCLVNGTAYSIKKGRTLINGTGYDITFAPYYKPVFANNTWDQIIEACHNNVVPDTWKVADHKPMTINGVDYQIDIIGKNHDDYSDGSGKAPLTFQMHDCYGTTKYKMNSSNVNTTSWAGSKLRTETIPAILAEMPVNIQNGIKDVNKLTATSGLNDAIKTTSDKLFIFSEMEVYGSVIKSCSGEGKQYDYYKAGNSKVKKIGSTASWWWLRSPRAGYRYNFCGVKDNGSITVISASGENGVCFGFCF